MFYTRNFSYHVTLSSEQDFVSDKLLRSAFTRLIYPSINNVRLLNQAL
jgi:hypothetical protein